MNKMYPVVTSIGLLLGLTACVERPSSVDPQCPGSGALVTQSSQDYCVYQGPIIETRFSCPAFAPNKLGLHEDTVVCSPQDMLPSDFEDALVEQLPGGWDLEPEPTIVEPPTPPTPAPTCVEGVGDGCADTLGPRPGFRLRRGMDLAEAMSDVLWGGAPDAELTQAAAAGMLATRAGIRQQAQRMLADPRARTGVDNFWRYYLGLRPGAQVSKDAALYPEYSAALLDKLSDETLQTIYAHTIEDRLSAMGLFTIPWTYADVDTAPYYDVTTSAALRVMTPPSRQGVLTFPSVMMTHSGEGADTGGWRRGLLVRDLMCQVLPAPPDNVEVTDPQPDPDTTTYRERFEALVSPPACASCHGLIDDPGFAFEAFDPVGRSRATDNGLPVDTTGTLIAREQAPDAPFQDAAELGVILSQDARVGDCMSSKMFWFYTGQVGQGQPSPGLGSSPVESALSAVFRASGYDVTTLMLAIVVADAFLYEPMP